MKYLTNPKSDPNPNRTAYFLLIHELKSSPNKNIKTNLNSQKTTNSIILVYKINILAYKIIILVTINDCFGMRTRFIPQNNYFLHTNHTFISKYLF